jgi:hypothetical protein
MTHHHYINEKSRCQAMVAMRKGKSSEVKKGFATVAKLGSHLIATLRIKIASWGSVPLAVIASTKKAVFDTQKKTFFLAAKTRKVFTTKKGEKIFEQKVSLKSLIPIYSVSKE